MPPPPHRLLLVIDDQQESNFKFLIKSFESLIAGRPVSPLRQYQNLIKMCVIGVPQREVLLLLITGEHGVDRHGVGPGNLTCMPYHFCQTFSLQKTLFIWKMLFLIK